MGITFCISLILYSVIYYMIIPKHAQNAPIQFKLQCFEQDKLNSEPSKGFQWQPALFAKVPVNSIQSEYDKLKGLEPSGAYIYEKGEIKQELKPQVVDLSQTGAEIKMENEFYSIQVVLEVSESVHNFERGNIYLQTQFNSFKRTQQSITVARSGYLEPKGSFYLIYKDVLSIVPFSGYLIPSLHTQTINIKIFEKFDNKDFGMESIEFLLSNEELQFREAKLLVKTNL